MRAEAKTPQPTIKGSDSSLSHDQTLNIQLLTSNNEEKPHEGQNWLNQELKRLPYQLYRFWLVFGIVDGVAVLYFFFRDLWTVYEYLNSAQLKYFIMAYAIPNISHILLFIGCGQMLFGMAKKKTRIAKSSLTKFQVIMVGSVAYLVLQISAGAIKFNINPVGILRTFALPFIVVIHLIGGFAVLKAFKKSHPLERHDSNISKDFWHQNEVIAAELEKYDEQLERWSYMIYKLWLWLSFFFEILLFCGSALAIVEELQTDERRLGYPIFQTICFGLNAVCSSEMLFVLKRKVFTRSRRTILLLKICIAVTVTILAVLGIIRKNFIFFVIDLAFHTLIPLINLIGAVFVNRILQERDKIANALSFDDVSYL